MAKKSKHHYLWIAWSLPGLFAIDPVGWWGGNEIRLLGLVYCIMTGIV